MCKFYEQQGWCSRGNSCTFAHGVHELSKGKGKGARLGAPWWKVGLKWGKRWFQATPYWETHGFRFRSGKLSKYEDLARIVIFLSSTNGMKLVSMPDFNLQRSTFAGVSSRFLAVKPVAFPRCFMPSIASRPSCSNTPEVAWLHERSDDDRKGALLVSWQQRGRWGLFVGFGLVDFISSCGVEKPSIAWG